MKELTVSSLLDLDKTIAKDLFDPNENAFDVLPRIKDFIIELSEKLRKDEFDEREPGVFVHKTAVVAPSAFIAAPCIIDASAEIRHCAFIRGSAIIGKNCVVGNSTELKNVVLFDNVQVPHYNYVGDSVLGFKSHMGAGSITSNVKSDKTPVSVRVDDEKVDTGFKKFGAILGDHVEVGCGTVLNPGSVVGRNTSVYPLSMVRGFIPENSIYKHMGEVIGKEIF